MNSEKNNEMVSLSRQGGAMILTSDQLAALRVLHEPFKGLDAFSSCDADELLALLDHIDFQTARIAELEQQLKDSSIARRKTEVLTLVRAPLMVRIRELEEEVSLYRALPSETQNTDKAEARVEVEPAFRLIDEVSSLAEQGLRHWWFRPRGAGTWSYTQILNPFGVEYAGNKLEYFGPLMPPGVKS